MSPHCGLTQFRSAQFRFSSVHLASNRSDPKGQTIVQRSFSDKHGDWHPSVCMLSIPRHPWCPRNSFGLESCARERTTHCNPSAKMRLIRGRFKKASQWKRWCAQIYWLASSHALSSSSLIILTLLCLNGISGQLIPSVCPSGTEEEHCCYRL